VFAPAYIRPTYDLAGNDNVTFIVNTPADTSAAKRSMYDFSNIATESDPLFWTAYLLSAYQHTAQTDADPDVEAAAPPPGGAILGTSDGDSEHDAQGAMIFLETIADTDRVTRSLGKSTPAACKEPAVAAHELGHLLYGPYHDEIGSGLMTKRCTDTKVLSFSPSTLAAIRSAPHP